MLKTTDIYLAAALMSLGAKLENVDREDPRHMEFQMVMEMPKFESPVLTNAVTAPDPAKSLTLTEYEKCWMNGELMVNAVQFAEAIKRMKSVVHSR